MWSRFSVIIAFLLSAILLATGIGSSLPSWLMTLVGIAYFLTTGFFTAKNIFSFRNITSLLTSPLFSLVPVGVIGTAMYFGVGLRPSIIQSLVFLPAIMAGFSFIFNRYKDSTDIRNIFSSFRPSLLQHTVLIAYIVLTIIHFVITAHSATVESVLGPWDILPVSFFALYFTRTLLVLTLFLTGVPAYISLPISSLHCFTAFSLFQILFPLNYGFDPFIHQATESIIAKNGVVTPLQPYYIGHYTLVVFLAKTLHIAVSNIDKWIVPIFASLTIPSFIYHALNGKKIRDLFLIATPLIFSFAAIISPTPWGLAFTFFTLTSLSIYTFLSRPNIIHAILALILAIFTTLIHPLAGLPALGFFFISLGLWLFFNYEKYRLLSSIFTTLAFLTTSLILPASFYINSLRSGGLSVTLGFNNGFTSVIRLVTSFLPSLPSRFNAPLDFVYMLNEATPLIITIFAVGGIYFLFTHLKNVWRVITTSYIITCTAIIFSMIVLSSFFQFEGLVNYEQSAYIERLSPLVVALLLPLVILGASHYIDYIIDRRRSLQTLILFIVLSTSMTAAIYISYPKRDAFAAYHGYSVSIHDINAVRWIHGNGEGKNYVVLSNQMVAAAAVGEYGFLKYYDINRNGKSENIFYYPIPTTSPLQGYFMDFLTNPSADIISAVKYLTSAEYVYVVITDYEPNPLKDVKNSTNYTYSYTDGKSWVFRY